MMIALITILTLAITSSLSQINPTPTNTSNDITCQFGSFKTSNNTCLQCLTSCSKCTSLMTPCNGCTEGYKLARDHNRCDECTPGQLSCNGSQIQCQPHYTHLNDHCQPECKVKNCQQCNSVQSISCKICKNGFIKNTTQNIDTCTQIKKIQLNKHLQSQPLSSLAFNKLTQATQIGDNNADSYLKNQQTGFNGNSFNTNSIYSNGNTSNSQGYSTAAQTSNPGTSGISSYNVVPGITGPFMSANHELYYIVDGKIRFIRGPSTVISNYTTTTTTVIPNFSSQHFNTPIINTTSGQTNYIPGRFFNQSTTVPITPYVIPNNPIVLPPIKTSPIITINTNPIPISNNTTTTTMTQQTTTSPTTQSPTGIFTVSPGQDVLQVINTTQTTGNKTSNVNDPMKYAITTNTCKIGSYYDGINSCLPCSIRCATCINSPNQCLQCNIDQGYIKQGWKCITNQSIHFKVNLTVPTVLPNDYVMGEGINQFKRNFKKNILPIPPSTNSSDADPDNVSMISLSNVTFNESEHSISVDGFVDRIPGIDINSLNKTISDNMNAANKIAPFGNITNSTVDVYPLNLDLKNNTQPTPNKLQKKPNLAAILIPTLLGALILLTILSILLCYYCRCCCFQSTQPAKKPAISPTANQNQSIKNTTPPMAASSHDSHRGLTSPNSDRPLGDNNFVQQQHHQIHNQQQIIPIVPIQQFNPIKKQNQTKNRIITSSSSTGYNHIEMKPIKNKQYPVVVATPNGLVHKNTNIYEKNNNDKIVSLTSLSCQSKIPQKQQNNNRESIQNIQQYHHNQIINKNISNGADHAVVHKVPTNSNYAVSTSALLKQAQSTLPIVSTNTLPHQIQQGGTNYQRNNPSILGHSFAPDRQSQSVARYTNKEKQYRDISANREIKLNKGSQERQEIIISPYFNQSAENPTPNNTNTNGQSHYGRQLQTASNNYPNHPTPQNNPPQQNGSRFVSNNTFQYSSNTHHGDPANSRPTGNINKHSYKNGKLVSQEFVPLESIVEPTTRNPQYYYTNSNGQEVEVKNLPNYIQKQDELRTLGIKDLTNKIDGYNQPNDDYTYHTKTETIQKSYKQSYTRF